MSFDLELKPDQEPVAHRIVETRDLARTALGIPDVSRVDVDALSTEEQATFAHGLRWQLAKAQQNFDRLAADANEAMNRAQTAVFLALRAAGGKVLPHDILDVKLTQLKEKQKRIEILRKLEGVIPKADFEKAIYQKVAIKANLDDATIAQLRQLLPGVKIVVEYEADGAVLNKMLRDYGPDSPAGKIIAEGYVEVEKGLPLLTIGERADAVQRVAQ